MTQACYPGVTPADEDVRCLGERSKNNSIINGLMAHPKGFEPLASAFGGQHQT